MCYSHINNGSISNRAIIDNYMVNTVGQRGKIMITIMEFAHTMGPGTTGPPGLNTILPTPEQFKNPKALA